MPKDAWAQWLTLAAAVCHWMAGPWILVGSDVDSLQWVKNRLTQTARLPVLQPFLLRTGSNFEVRWGVAEMRWLWHAMAMMHGCRGRNALYRSLCQEVWSCRVAANRSPSPKHPVAFNAPLRN